MACFTLRAFQRLISGFNYTTATAAPPIAKALPNRKAMFLTPQN